MASIKTPAAPKDKLDSHSHAVPKQINFSSIVSEIAPIVSLPDSPLQTRVPDDCPCVRMLFGLIAQIPKRKKTVTLGTKGTVVDLRQITPQINLLEPKQSRVKIAPGEQNDIKPAPPAIDAVEERIKPFILPEGKVKVCVDQSAQTKAN